MAMNLSRQDIQRAASRAESVRRRMLSMRGRMEKVAERAVHTVEVGTSAFGFGVLHGSTFDPASGKAGISLFGIPLELIAGAGLHGAGYLGLGGKMSSHLHGFGDGAIAAFLTTTGIDVGLKLKARREAGGAAVSGGGSGFLENTVTMPRGLGMAQRRNFADEILSSSIAEADAKQSAIIAP